jgi:hypothetical protein
MASPFFGMVYSGGATMKFTYASGAKPVQGYTIRRGRKGDWPLSFGHLLHLLSASGYSQGQRCTSAPAPAFKREYKVVLPQKADEQGIEDTLNKMRANGRELAGIFNRVSGGARGAAVYIHG